ncbi:MAG: membrane dipeptidase, partial [Clostridia bacterium]|nr:membrane dipeptidase [Clostridia bacterium]
MQKIIYADMHCDSVSVCCRRGENFIGFNGQTNVEKLVKSGCALQCFALFTEGEKADEDFNKYSSFYNAQIAARPDVVCVRSSSDIDRALKEGKLAALLTVENMGFLKGDLGGIDKLKDMGVGMASLVWNNANEWAYPNLIWKGNVPDFAASEGRGLTPEGMQAIERLQANGIIIDVSHLSDGGVMDILKLAYKPIVASHSNCRAVCGVSRNLTDEQLKGIADGGGVAGLNYCRDFIDGESAFEGLYAHFTHILNTGGEDLPALGSDFDGIPVNPDIPDCTHVPALLNYLI